MVVFSNPDKPQCICYNSYMKNKTKDTFIIIFLSFVIIVCLIFSTLSIIRFERHLSSSGRRFFSAHQKFGVRNINNIQGWMTFDYLDYVFSLPPLYLKQHLNLSDQRYPNISINQYAKKHNIDQTIFLQNIKTTLSTYFTENASSSTSRP